MPSSLYDQEYDKDLHAWAMQSVRMVRERRFSELDQEHLAEELEPMGKSELRSLESRLALLLAHLLKWRSQPDQRSKSWRRSLIEQRKRIARLLRDSPSLEPRSLWTWYRVAYDSAVRLAADETGLDEADFPPSCPYRMDQALEEGFYPDEAEGAD